MPANTLRSHPRRSSHATPFAAGVLLVAACTSFESHAGVECMTDEEAVIKCEPMFETGMISLEGRKRWVLCAENCVLCGSVPDDLTTID